MPEIVRKIYMAQKLYMMILIKDLGRPDLKVRKFPGKNKIFQSGKREF
jgi:hypothetical protein